MSGISQTIRVAVDVPLLRVLEVFANACDTGAFAYWIRRGSFSCELPASFLVEHDVPWLTPEQIEEWKEHRGYFAPLVPGGRATFAEDEGDRWVAHVLDLAAVERGLALMASKHPRHFADLLSENDDAETADVFVQLCVLGEVRYG